MTTSLTLFMTNTNDTLLTSARTLIANTTGATGVGVDTKLGTGTGWAEIQSQGNAGTWAGLGAIGTPTGKGWIYDSTALEGQAFTSGNWTPTIRVTYNSANGNANVTVRFRVYQYNSGVYTLIADSSTNITITTTATTFALTAVSVGEVDFNTGDKVYCDIWANVTSNSNTATAATFRINEANSTTQGNVQEQLVTPGYNAITSISLSDTGTLADTQTLATVTPPVSDSGTESGDTPTISVTTSISETGTENDSIPSLSVTTSVADSGAVGESTPISVTTAVSDQQQSTALTVYFTHIASSTLPTAAQMATTAGGASVGVDTALGTATGIGEIFPLGTNSAWSGLGSYPTTPSGNGLLLDSALLDNTTLQSGNWTPTLRGTLHNGNANVTADLTLIAWILLANGGYTSQIGSVTLASQTIPFATSTTYTFPAGSFGSVGLNAGDRLYVALYANVTANPNTATTATLRFNFSSTSSQGVNTNQLVTPGFVLNDLSETIGMTKQFSITESSVEGDGVDISGRSPLSLPYALSGVPTGGPYVVANGIFFAQNGKNLPRLYGSTFYPATEGGSPVWQSNATAFIDGVISTYVANRFTVIRPTDQWGNNPTLSWDNPQIWQNMDYLVQQAALNNIYVQMDLSGWKAVLSARGETVFDSNMWLSFLAEVGAHYANVNNILFYTIAGEPSFPRTQNDVNALLTFYANTYAALRAADPNHLISLGGLISMNNGLANWWQQVWNMTQSQVCCYKTYSQNDVNNLATYSAYGSQTLGKPTVQQEFGIPQYVGDGVATGQSFNSFTDSRASYFDQVYKGGEANGTRTFIFWNYDHQGDNVPQTPDFPVLTDSGLGSDGISVPFTGVTTIDVNDGGVGTELWTGLTQSFDVDPISSPVTWGIIQQHAWSNPTFPDVGTLSDPVQVAILLSLSDSGVGVDRTIIASFFQPPPISGAVDPIPISGTASSLATVSTVTRE